MKAYLIALSVGALLAVWTHQKLAAPDAPVADTVSTIELPRCLGRRSKAQRIAYWRQRTGLDPVQIPAVIGEASVTFNRDIAPILFEACAICHRPGEVTPFSVLTYEDVKPWAWVIGVVTQNRYMPPWPPGDRADARFESERRLADNDIALIARWVDEGAVEGVPEDLPEAPTFSPGWRNGEPDLVLTLPAPFELPADGVDVYRNFVLPVPVDRVRWVRSVEIKPGNKRIVHHAVMQVDRYGTGRRLEGAEPGIGFGGMEMGSTENPGGHFIGWSPGKKPLVVPEDMAWKVEPGTDIVLQLHMLPTGKSESINPSIGLYFTDRPSTRQPFSLVLRNGRIDIPANEAAYTVQDAVTIPVDLQVLGVYPHAHYLAKDLKATATLPDGRVLTLIHINDWDFGWQDEYRYTQPVHLPAGTRIVMRYLYDNSATNPRNPNSPPRRVVAGNSSLDEMAIFMLQVLTDAPHGEARVRESVMRARLERNPDSWFAHNLLGASLREQGKTDEAISHFLEAERLNPTYAGVAYNLGNALQSKGNYARAIRHYERALKLQPSHGQAHNNLGTAFLNVGRLDKATQHYRMQLVLNSRNTEVLTNLGTALAAKGLIDEAMTHFEDALGVDKDFVPARIGFADMLRMKGHLQDALREYQAVINAGEKNGFAHLGAGIVYTQQADYERSLGHLKQALHLDRTLGMALNGIAWGLATSPAVDSRQLQHSVEVAELADETTSHKSPEVLDTLAAAYAAVARFELAAKTVREALALIAPSHVYAPEFRARLALYEARKPYLAPSTN